MKLLLITGLILVFTPVTDAQTGVINGQVIDENSGEALPGAVVLIQGTTKGVSTDADGYFKLSSVPAGTLNLVISYLSNAEKMVPGIIVRNGELQHLTIELKNAISNLEEVVVAVTLDRQSNTSLVLHQKNNAAVSDGISAETIRKTPDRSASDVLKRVSGASVQDSKFAIIRGLGDRYNSAVINGAPLPSSESDRKAFALDLFPANMIESMVILKSATPDQPADFAGGIININTRSVSDSNFSQVTIGGSVHRLTSFKPFSTYKGGKSDWLGIDDGTRALPDGIPGTKEYALLANDEKAQMAKLMTPSWKTDQKNALPGFNLQYAASRNFKLGNRRTGLMFVSNYRNNLNRSANIRREFEESSTGVIQRSELKDDVFEKTIMNSAMLNLVLNPGGTNELNFKNLYSITSSDKVNLREGIREMDNDPRQYEHSSSKWFTQNLLYTGQFEGRHRELLGKMNFNWTGGVSDVCNSTPNVRRMVYQKQSGQDGETGENYVAVIQNSGTIPTAAGNMFWATTNERIYSLKYEFSLPLPGKMINTELKFGGMQQVRDRQFDARNLGFSKYRKSGSPGAPFDNELLLLTEDEIFDAAHLGLQENGKGGFKLEEATKVHDNYKARAVLHAGFCMADARIHDKLRVTGGVRLESYRQLFSYVEIGSNLEKNIDTTVTDLLPSVNIVYSLNSKANLRASYYQTLSRPEFRELAPFQFYNFAADNIISGSPALKRALIHNADIRYELFPGYGQIFSISAFYKKFNDPIELYMRAGTSGAAELTYTNVPSATNYGSELEYRWKLDVFTRSDSNMFLSNSTIFTNLAIIRSMVNMGGLNGVKNRPLQGQSPFLINAGYTFNHPRMDWTCSISFNIVGRRIYIGGNVQEPDVWEKGRHVVDFQFSKKIGERLSVRINISDVLAQRRLFYQNVNSADRYEEGKDNRWQETTFGQSASFNLAYKF